MIDQRTWVGFDAAGLDENICLGVGDKEGHGGAVYRQAPGKGEDYG